MRTIAELKAEKERQRMSYDKLAELSGVPKTTLTNILLGYTQTVNTENYQAIERALGFTDSWTEEEKALGAGNHPILLTEREHDWVITLNEAEEVLGEQYVATVIQMVKLNIQQKK